MERDPERCDFRLPSPEADQEGVFGCALVRRILGTQREDAGRVRAEACRECCGYRQPSTTHFNPVIASLVYQGAKRIAEDPGASWLEREEAVRSRQYVVDRLELLRTRAEPVPISGGLAVDGRRIRWAVGLVTAPRPVPTVDQTLRSIVLSGFSSVHIFAEPGSWIPEEFAYLPRTLHGRPLGNLGNFYTTLATLLMLEPHADCYAIFQDDVEVAEGLRAWCDNHLWPHEAGLFSLYTCGVLHSTEVGWRVVSTGMHHTFGALAFVFRRHVLKAFLTDGRLLELRETGFWAGDDGIVGEWASRRGIGIAYHTPSLVSHIGTISAISQDGQGIGGPLTRTEAVRSVGEIAGWKAPPLVLGRVGLVGWNTATGLGFMNRDIATHLLVEKWLVPTHPHFPTLEPPPTRTSIQCVALEAQAPEIKKWLRGLDWVLFVEVPYIPRLAHWAREMGVRVACVPMWECAHLGLDWMNLADVMICSTHFTYELFSDWKYRFGFGWDLVYIPWPIDTARFRFRGRARCDRFLFVNGTGGSRAARGDGTLTDYRRKGMDIVLGAARLLRPIPFLIYSQVESAAPIPDNVELRFPPESNSLLYAEADVCVQPSRWEGLGLQMLECQAAGLPLVTTDAPPMNEFRPVRTVPARETELLSIVPPHPMTSHNVAPEDLATCLESLYRTDISGASRSARSFIEEEHSWEHALPLLIRALAR